MAKLTKEAIFTASEIITEYDEKKADRVITLENEIDCYEDELGTYMVKLSQQQLFESDSHKLSVILHCLSDFERISDHCSNIAVCLMQVDQDNYDTHESLNDMKHNELFNERYAVYKKKYVLP